MASARLRGIDRDVRLVDELLHAGRVLRTRGDTDREGRADRLGRSVDFKETLGDGDANPLRDLHGLGVRRLREQHAELLAAEARGNVVAAQLLAQRVRDPFDDDVAGKVPVSVVDVPQEVEVGHQQRDGIAHPTEACSADEAAQRNVLGCDGDSRFDAKPGRQANAEGLALVCTQMLDRARDAMGAAVDRGDLAELPSLFAEQ